MPSGGVIASGAILTDSTLFWGVKLYGSTLEQVCSLPWSAGRMSHPVFNIWWE
ncbi:MAG TPA: hypothetical protein VFF53_11390 [Geobacteraceae bacterium]|nr:hypothetical protein [Geobacteraceae bacterium]